MIRVSIGAAVAISLSLLGIIAQLAVTFGYRLLPRQPQRHLRRLIHRGQPPDGLQPVRLAERYLGQKLEDCGLILEVALELEEIGCFTDQRHSHP